MPHEQLAPQGLTVGSGPLGLRLTKSDLLVNSIQMKLAQAAKPKGRHTTSDDYHGVLDTRSITNPTVKPSQFHAFILKIGTWEWKSRYDGDLIAKFYYTNSKLAWEILNEGLKSKIVIYWQDISALKVTCPEGGSGTLEIMLSRRPSFYKETNPQPWRNTSWLTTIDFTDGQASTHRRHVLQCAPGILNKHIVKLLSSNHRLYSLSQENTTDQESPYFEQWQSEPEVLESSNVQSLYRRHDYHQVGRQQIVEPVPMSIGTNAVGKNHNGSQDGMPTLIPSSVPTRASVITRTPSGGLELQRDIFNSNNLSMQTSRQTPLNISSGRIMNDTANYMTNPSKRQNLLTSVGASSSSLIRPEDVMKFVNDFRTTRHVNTRIPPMYSHGSSKQKTRELDLSNYAFTNSTTHTFNQINSANPSSNDNSTINAMALEKITHDLLSDTYTDTEPSGTAEEAMIISRVNSLSNLLQQDLAPATVQSSQASNAHNAAAAAAPHFDVEATTQVLDVAPSGSSGGSCSGTGRNNGLLPSMGMERMSWEQEPAADIEMDMAYLSELLPFCP
ncbi:uncharacterized protein LOC133898524 [Phragmites australis]|uniref:uncharacterized protein LOC133898524 n=1 Tax=Phragmites australis TaxID=29695 RepID=UPI002D76E345|nr:uncharacterized protein LOC133898524 [Phragmites australis]